jgi:hypothetical protein
MPFNTSHFGQVYDALHAKAPFLEKQQGRIRLQIPGNSITITGQPNRYKALTGMAICK